MGNEDYNDFVKKIKGKIFKDGRPLYKIAPEIGINDCTLKRFIDGRGVTIFTVIQIADYFKIKIFSHK